MATKGKGKPERFIRKSKIGATVVFTQVSKHYLTCETSTESTNRPSRKKRKKKKPLFTGNDWVLSLSCWFETPDYNYSTSTSPDSPKAKRVQRLIFLLFSFYRRITVMNTGTAHRSCQTMFTLMHYSMTSPHCTQPVNTMRDIALHMYKMLP